MSCDGDHNYKNVGEWHNKKKKKTYKIFKCASCGEKYEEEIPDGKNRQI